MEVNLIVLNSSNNNNNSSSSSSSSSRIASDIENNVTIVSRIGNDNNKTIEELIKSDRSFVLFLILLGLYIEDGRNSIVIKILARIWQFSLLLFGGIGTCWSSFVIGGYWISNLHELLSTSKHVDIFISFGQVLSQFIAPLLQVISLIIGIFNVYKQFKHTVNADTISPILSSCKRSSITFFIFMFLLVIIIDPFLMTRDTYRKFLSNLDDGYFNQTGQQTYSLFVFSQFTATLFLNLSVTCYLTVMMFFTSLSMKIINSLQEDVIKMIETDTLEFINYLEVKDKIISFKNASYFSIKLLSITAAINVITFMFILWFNSYLLVNRTDILLLDVGSLPYLLKEIVFFFYILYRASSINTLHDKFRECANNKFWEVRNKYYISKNSSDLDLLLDYSVIQNEKYAVFMLGSIEVRKGRVLTTIAGFILFCLSILLKFKQTV